LAETEVRLRGRAKRFVGERKGGGSEKRSSRLARPCSLRWAKAGSAVRRDEGERKRTVGG
jgi:hypothetical protein